MDKEKFIKDIPDIEGFTIGALRTGGKGDVVGFVLINKAGEKKYILYFGDDLKVEPYW